MKNVRCRHCGEVIYQPSGLNPRYFAPSPTASWIHLTYVATDHNAEPEEDDDAEGLV